MAGRQPLVRNYAAGSRGISCGNPECPAARRERIRAHLPLVEENRDDLERSDVWSVVERLAPGGGSRRSNRSGRFAGADARRRLAGAAGDEKQGVRVGNAAGMCGNGCQEVRGAAHRGCRRDLPLPTSRWISPLPTIAQDERRSGGSARPAAKGEAYRFAAADCRGPQGHARAPALEAKAIAQQREVEALIKAQKKEILQKEIEIYGTTWNDINAAITQYAKQHQIDLVLRHRKPQTSKAPKNEGQELMQRINAPVLYQSDAANGDEVEITREVLAQLNGGNAGSK